MYELITLIGLVIALISFLTYAHYEDSLIHKRVDELEDRIVNLEYRQFHIHEGRWTSSEPDISNLVEYSDEDNDIHRSPKPR